jgi:RNA polymerase sigma-70 factor (ECF subfamily)
MSGSDAAWREIFDAHYVKIYRFFRSRVATHQQAEDLSADVFLEAFRSIANFRWQGSPFEAWLFGIARRILASYYRAKPRGEGQLPGHVRDEYLAVEVRDLLARIPDDYRAALELRFVVGLSGSEAAAVMGRSHGAFRSLLLRAVRAFRAESLQDEQPVPLPVAPPLRRPVRPALVAQRATGLLSRVE